MVLEFRGFYLNGQCKDNVWYGSLTEAPVLMLLKYRWLSPELDCSLKHLIHDYSLRSMALRNHIVLNVP